MQTLILKIDTSNHALHLANFLKHLPYIHSITPKPAIIEDSLPANLTSADWIRPGRPATDEEIEQMLDKCEQGKGIPARFAKEQTMKELDKWTTLQKK